MVSFLGQQCYETKSDFQRSCSIVHNGVVDGGRCFFLRGQVLGYSPFNWTEAWAECARRGGTMAQIHTSHEFAAVSAYLAVSWNLYDLHMHHMPPFSDLIFQSEQTYFNSSQPRSYLD